MISINIRVLRHLVTSTGLDQKELYRNSVEWNEDISFPFDSTVKVLKILYPASDCIIQFSVS